MSKPIIAIVGRPNVGKSTFFNKVAGSRISIVVNTPGVTRDRIYADGEWLGKQFTMIDTGGIELKSDDTMHKHIKEQAELAIDIADIILFFVDGREPLTSDDINIASILRKTKKPILLVVNKIDNFQTQDYSEFYSLGLDLFPISSEQKYGVGDLLDNIVERFPDIDTEKEAEGIKIAVVGKPNAGKSSLVNKILGYDRTIVTNIAGTTRDAIDTPFTVDGQKYVIIDTAGIRRKRSVENDTIEGYSVVRALAAVRRADVCLVVFDAEEGMSEQDVKIAGYVHEQGKPSIIVINKWDLIEKDTKTVEKYNNDLATDLAFMDYFKSITVSALTGQRVNKLIEQVNYVYEKHHLRITTGLLNDVVSDALSAVEPPSKKGKRLKIKYATEPAVAPPTFVFFVNDSSLVHFSYKRYLENSIRKSFSLDGTPIKLIFRDGEHKEEI